VARRRDRRHPRLTQRALLAEARSSSRSGERALTSTSQSLWNDCPGRPGDGDWTRLFSDVGGPKGRVYSFVPAEVARFKNDPVGRMQTLAGR